MTKLNKSDKLYLLIENSALIKRIQELMDTRIANEIMAQGSVPEDFRPTTNLLHAFLVVSTMRDNGFTIVIETYNIDDDDGQPFFSVQMTDFIKVFKSEGPALPHAICDAALKVVDYA